MLYIRAAQSGARGSKLAAVRFDLAHQMFLAKIKITNIYESLFMLT